MTEYFWTDLEQAQQRLTNSVVLYDGQPVLIAQVEEGDDGIPRGQLYTLPDLKTTVRKKLNSPKFKRFRELPPLGWINHHGRGQAVYAARRAVNGRVHGVSAGNTLISIVNQAAIHPVLQAGAMSFNTLIGDKGFVDGHNNDFPNLKEILGRIKPSTAVAFARTFCVIADMDGVRWLYRGPDRVGIFAEPDVLSLPRKFSYLREEIMAEKLFILNSIREI